MKLSNYYSNLLIVENKKQAKDIIKTSVNNKEEYDYLMKLIEDTDPSNNNKYMGRIAKWITTLINFKTYDDIDIKGGDVIILTSVMSDIKEHLASFHHFAEMANPPEKFRRLTNIDSKEWNSYTDWKDRFLKFVNEYNRTKVNTREGKQGQQKLYEDDKVIVYKILSKQGMAYCGKDAPWCVTMPASSFYEGYTEGGKYYFLVLRNKEIPITEEMLKVGHGDKGQMHRQFSLPNKEGYAMIALLIHKEYNIYSEEETFTDYGNTTESIDGVDINKYNSELGYNLDELLKKLGINDINNKTEEIKSLYLYENGSLIQYIDNPSEKLKIASVSNNSNNIKYIDNPSETISRMVVVENGSLIQYIDNPSLHVQYLSVKHNSSNIKYIDNPDDKILELSIKDDINNIEYIKNKIKLDIEIQELFVKYKWFTTVEKIINPIESLQLLAIKNSYHYLSDIENPTEKVIKTSIINSSGFAISYIKNQTEELQLLALSITKPEYSENLFSFINNPTKFVEYYYKRKYKDKQPYDNKLEKKYQYYISTGKILNEHYERLKKLMLD